MTRKTFDFVMEPEGTVLESLLLWATDLAVTCGFVVRSGFPTNDRAVCLAADLEPYLKSSQEVISWPGTELTGGQHAISSEYAFSPPVARILLATERQLYAWVSPELPEDLYLLRANREVLMGSIAHERDAWLEIDDSELKQLENVVPDIRGILAEKD
jgi:hypothetical protein